MLPPLRVRRENKLRIDIIDIRREGVSGWNKFEINLLQECFLSEKKEKEIQSRCIRGCICMLACSQTFRNWNHREHRESPFLVYTHICILHVYTHSSHRYPPVTLVLYDPAYLVDRGDVCDRGREGCCPLFSASPLARIVRNDSLCLHFCRYHNLSNIFYITINSHE